MPFNTPNIFIGGTKAKAVEVNENFEAIKDGLNSHTESIVEIRGTVQDAVDYVNGELRDEFQELITSSRTKFCVNSANVDMIGNPDVIAYADNELIFKIGGDFPALIATNVRGKAFTLETASNLTVPAAYGTQTIAINDGAPEFMGKICRQTTEPAIIRDFVRPNLTSSIPMGGEGFGISATNTYSTSYPDYYAVNGVLTNDWIASGVVADYIFYNSNKLKVSKLTIRNRPAANEGSTSGNVYGSNDGTTWSLLTNYSNSNTTAASSWSITIPEAVRDFYNYYKISSLTGVTRFGMSDLDITAQEQSIKTGDIWLNTLTEPLTAFKFDDLDGNGWQEYDGVPIGSVILSNGVITSVNTFPFNQNGYDVNTQTDLCLDKKAPLYASSKKEIRANGTLYIADKAGFIWCHKFQYGQNVSQGTLTINDVVFPYSGSTQTATSIVAGQLFMPISIGDRYTIAESTQAFFLPQKGVNL